jgi:CBS domain-containing membrane protein
MHHPAGFAHEIMSKDVVTLEEAETLEFVEESMRALRFRHMPVVDRGRLVGLISHRDVLRVSASSLLPESQQQTKYFAKKFLVRDVMTRNVATVHPDTPLLEVASLMQKGKLGCVPVVEGENTLVGIITEADFVDLCARLLQASH